MNNLLLIVLLIPMITEILGNCPSKSNNYIPVAKGRMIKNPVVKTYEKGFILQLPAAWKSLNLSKKFYCSIDFYFRNEASDLDGGWKIVLDCLERAGVIKNDKLMYHHQGRKFIDEKNPRVIIEITELKNGSA